MVHFFWGGDFFEFVQVAEEHGDLMPGAEVQTGEIVEALENGAAVGAAVEQTGQFVGAGDGRMGAWRQVSSRMPKKMA